MTEVDFARRRRSFSLSWQAEPTPWSPSLGDATLRGGFKLSQPSSRLRPPLIRGAQCDSLLQSLCLPSSLRLLLAASIQMWPPPSNDTKSITICFMHCMRSTLNMLEKKNNLAPNTSWSNFKCHINETRDKLSLFLTKWVIPCKKRRGKLHIKHKNINVCIENDLSFLS